MWLVFQGEVMFQAFLMVNQVLDITTQAPEMLAMLFAVIFERAGEAVQENAIEAMRPRLLRVF